MDSKIQRNDLCWCGSGLKYKKCHLEQDEHLAKLARKGIPVPQKTMIKTEEQIEGIRLACQLSKEILDMVEEKIGTGITTGEINKWVHDYTVNHDAYPAPLNYNGFPKSVCTSLNEVVCHGIPDDTVLKDGDVINVDVTSILNGYYGDMSRMFTVGKCSAESIRLINVAKECLDLGNLARILPISIGR